MAHVAQENPHLSQALAHSVQSVTKPFTRDGFSDASGAYAVCGDFCSLPDNPFECCDHRGRHLWLMPPRMQASRAIQHYLNHKRLRRTRVHVLQL